MNKNLLKLGAAEVINLITAHFNGNKSLDSDLGKAFLAVNLTVTAPALLGNIAGDYVSDSTLISFGAGLVADVAAQQGVAYLLTTDAVKTHVGDFTDKKISGSVIKGCITNNTVSSLLQYCAFEAIDYYFPSEEISPELDLVGGNA